MVLLQTENLLSVSFSLICLCVTTKPRFKHCNLLFHSFILFFHTRVQVLLSNIFLDINAYQIQQTIFEQRIIKSRIADLQPYKWSQRKQIPNAIANSILTPYLSALDFWHSIVWNFEFDELDFFPSLNCIFTACVACKNPVQTRKKSSSSNLMFKTGEKNQMQINRGLDNLPLSLSLKRNLFPAT